MTTSFDLTTEPWIPVVDLAGRHREVGLHEVLRDAHTIRRITGETPPMTAALYRLVLAVLHRAYGPASQAAWGQLWTGDRLPEEPLADHVIVQRENFDLFHPQRPFMQCTELSSVRRSSVAKLIPHKAVGNNVTLFDHTTAEDRVDLTPAEAARWLVTAQAFDPGGMKTPFEKDKSSERAPCSSLGVVLVEGTTLKETLLLNALVYKPDGEAPLRMALQDVPAWEWTPPPGKPDKRHPRGWTDLLTWPSRRILLFPEVVDGRVVVAQAVLTPGVRMLSDLSNVEMMAAFRQPNAANGKPKPGAPLLAVRLHPVRGIWRHSVELLLMDVRAKDNTRLRPRALTQLADLLEFDRIPEDTVYTLRVFGQRLDSKASVVEGYLEEEVPAPLALVRAQDESLAALIGTAVELADEAGAALRSMQRDYFKDMRAIPTTDLDMSYWPTLTQPFSAFLRAVNAARIAGRSEVDATKAWAREVHVSATAAADRWAVGTGKTERNLSLIGKQQDQFMSRLDRLVRIFHVKVAKYATRDDVE